MAAYTCGSSDRRSRSARPSSRSWYSWSATRMCASQYAQLGWRPPTFNEDAELRSTGSAMNVLRRHLIAIALTTVSVHMGTLTAGALRVCWGHEHRHAGNAAPDCVMQHHSSAPAQVHGHHGHGSANPPI